MQIGEDQAQFAKTYRATYRRMIQVTKSTDALYSLEVRNVAAEPGAKTAGPDNLKVSSAATLPRRLAVTATTELRHCRPARLPDHGLRRGDIRHQRDRQSPLSPRSDNRRSRDRNGGGEEGRQSLHRYCQAIGGHQQRRRGCLLGDPARFPEKARAQEEAWYNCGGPRPDDISGEASPKTHLDPKNAVIDLPKVVNPPKKTLVPVIVTPTPLICAGGVVRNDRCACPTGFNAVKAASNAYRCIRTKPMVLNLPKAAKPMASPQKLRGL